VEGRRGEERREEETKLIELIDILFSSLENILNTASRMQCIIKSDISTNVWSLEVKLKK
jgi:hypothetical protein